MGSRWHCLEKGIYTRSAMWCQFLLCIRWWKGVMVLRRRWTDLALSFVSVPLLGCIASICAVREFVVPPIGRYRGRCLPWLVVERRVGAQKKSSEKRPGRIWQVRHSIEKQSTQQTSTVHQLKSSNRSFPLTLLWTNYSIPWYHWVYRNVFKDVTATTISHSHKTTNRECSMNPYLPSNVCGAWMRGHDRIVIVIRVNIACNWGSINTQLEVDLEI